MKPGKTNTHGWQSYQVHCGSKLDIPGRELSAEASTPRVMRVELLVFCLEILWKPLWMRGPRSGCFEEYMNRQ